MARAFCAAVPSRESPESPLSLTALPVPAYKGGNKAGPHYGCAGKHAAAGNFRKRSEDEQWFPDTMSRNTSISEIWAPGSPSGPLARPGACCSGVGGVRGGGPASAGWSPVAGRAAQVQHAPRREVRPGGQSRNAYNKLGVFLLKISANNLCEKAGIRLHSMPLQRGVWIQTPSPKQ